jgi:hypothetical protein
LKVALVVGTLLNLVNQGGNLLEGLPLNTTQMLLNFLVPFCVSSYSAARNELIRCGEENRPPPHPVVRSSLY